MPKHNQTKSLGSITDFLSAPQSDPRSESDRIAALERRVSTLEVLLNDVMMQLDQPQQNPPKDQKRERKSNRQVNAKAQAAEKPAKTQPKEKGNPSKPKKSSREKQDAHNAVQQQAAKAVVEKNTKDVIKLLSDGKKRTESEIRKELKLGNNAFGKAVRGCELIKNDENPDRKERLYFMEKTS